MGWIRWRKPVRRSTGSCRYAVELASRRWRGGHDLPCLMAFFLAPPLKVRLRGGAGRAAQCASRRTRTRRAMMMGCDGERLPRQSSAQQFVRLWQSKLVIGDRAGWACSSTRQATACGEGCERLNGFAPPRPLEAPSLVAQRKGLPPDKRPRSRTRREDRVRRSTKPARPGRGAQRSQPTLLWVSPATRLGTWRPRNV